MASNEMVLKSWSSSAPFWEKHRQTLREMFAPVTQALIEDAEIGPRDVVLDVATGPGEPALGVAAFVSGGGRVVGVDPVAEMVAAARRAAERMAIANAQFEVAATEHLPFSSETFDAVVSRFGAMFFPAPVDAVREMARVLKPGRKMALAVWDFADNNPFLYTLQRVIEKYVEFVPPGPDALDTFRYASPGKLSGVLSQAGLSAPSERLVPFTIHASVSVEEFWTFRCEISDKLREKLAILSPEQAGEVKRQSLDALGEYSTANGMSFPAQVVIVTGTKSAPGNP